MNEYIKDLLFELHQSFNSYIHLLPMDILNIISNNFILNTDSLERIYDFLLFNDNFIIKSDYERIKILDSYDLTIDIIETKNNIVKIEIECISEELSISCSIDKYLNYTKRNKNNNRHVMGTRQNFFLTNEFTFIGICN